MLVGQTIDRLVVYSDLYTLLKINVLELGTQWEPSNATYLYTTNPRPSNILLQRVSVFA